MQALAKIVAGPIPIDATSSTGNGIEEVSGVGARLTFHGIVRPMEEGRALAALDYETYHPMAETELARLASNVASEFQLLALTVVHSRGVVPAGQCSLVVTINAEHRQAALNAMAAFIDRLKQDVPIWKHPVWKE